MTRKELWIEQFENLSTEDKVALFNEYASENRTEEILDAFCVWASQYIKENDIETSLNGVYTDEIIVEDRDIFGDVEEHGLVMEFDDGHAENDCYEMSYPRLSELTDVQKIEIYLYTNRNEIVPFDVALKFGKLEKK